jgi:hypothetical protein
MKALCIFLLVFFGAENSFGAEPACGPAKRREMEQKISQFSAKIEKSEVRVKFLRERFWITVAFYSSALLTELDAYNVSFPGLSRPREKLRKLHAAFYKRRTRENADPMIDAYFALSAFLQKSGKLTREESSKYMDWQIVIHETMDNWARANDPHMKLLLERQKVNFDLIRVRAACPVKPATLF